MGLFSKKDSKTRAGKKIASSLSSNKQMADIIIESIDDGVILVDSAGLIHVFNPGASKMTGWNSKDAINLDYRSILKFADDKGKTIEDNQTPVHTVLTTSEPVRDNTAILVKKDGKTVSIDINISPLLNDNKEVTGAVAILRDVSDQRREEKQRADFISTASHEMRTPVAAIEGYLALALNEKVAKIDVKARSYLEKAHSSTQHLGKLFQDLLTSAKAEDGRLTNNPVIMEMSEFTEKLVDDLRFTAEKKGLMLELLMGAHQRANATSIDVSQKVVKPLLYVTADPERMREVITNLFDNAVKYTESGRLSIGITGDSEVVQFHITDTGPGIPEADLSHLFQKFYRVDNSATRTIGGTGLGLYICRKIVSLYGGRIWVESKEGQGSTFYINLPRVDSAYADTILKKQAGNQSVIQNGKL